MILSQVKNEHIQAFLQGHDWDFLIGSVHEINGELFEVDKKWSREQGETLWLRYFELLCAAVSSGYFSLVSHPVRMRVKPVISTTIVEAQGVTRDFHGGGGVVHALRGIDLRIEPGEFVALRGRSGSGKTTLLNILIGLDNPTQGRVIILGEDLARLSETERARLRRESIGMMFQNAHLFPSLTAQENVEVPLRLARLDPMQRTQKSRRALEMVGLALRAHHRGLELSGGEQQRVALARALVHEPRFIVADEPTGNLDSVTGRDIAQLLHAIVHQSQIGLLVATHDATIVASSDRVLQIQDGRIVETATV